MKKKIILFLSFAALFGMNISTINAQELSVPEMWLMLKQDSMNVRLVDVKDSSKNLSLQIENQTVTNFNPSLLVNDSNVIEVICEDLSRDSVITVFTAYQTEEDTIVGLWEIGQDSNRTIWLNSRKASYNDYGITYRETNEKGVIVNTTRFVYNFTEDIDTLNMGDTLFIGREGVNDGDKNFCEYIYIKGTIDKEEQQKWESYLAIKYGALLHNIYVNSIHDTLWDSKCKDRAYSYGVAGIGRDDVYPLEQTKSRIYKDSLIIETVNALGDGNYLLWGENAGENILMSDDFLIDTVRYHPLEKGWKLRAHTDLDSTTTKITYNYPEELNAGSIRMLVNTQDSVFYTFNSIILSPDLITDSCVIFDDMAWHEGEDYYIRVIMEGDSIYKPIIPKSDIQNISETSLNDNCMNDSDSMRVKINPNPSTGDYTLSVEQTDEKPLSIYIMDTQGKIIYMHNGIEATKEYILNHTMEREGIYFINVQTPDSKRTVKLVIAK